MRRAQSLVRPGWPGALVAVGLLTAGSVCAADHETGIDSRGATQYERRPMPGLTLPIVPTTGCVIESFGTTVFVPSGGEVSQTEGTGRVAVFADEHAPLSRVMAASPEGAVFAVAMTSPAGPPMGVWCGTPLQLVADPGPRLTLDADALRDPDKRPRQYRLAQAELPVLAAIPPDAPWGDVLAWMTRYGVNGEFVVDPEAAALPARQTGTHGLADNGALDMVGDEVLEREWVSDGSAEQHAHGVVPTVRARQVRMRRMAHPSYPEAALEEKVGDVDCRVRVVIDKVGVPISAQAIDCHPLFVEEGESAALDARWYPYRLNGQSILVQFSLTYRFVMR